MSEDLAVISARMKATQGQQSSVARTGQFLNVRTLSGRALLCFDPDGVQEFLEPGCTDEVLGTVVFESLAKSRFFEPGVSRQYLAQASERNESWMPETLHRYGYRAQRDMFKDMETCDIQLVNEIISIAPNRWLRGETWQELPESYHIQLPATSTPAELGAAIRRALNHVRERK